MIRDSGLPATGRTSHQPDMMVLGRRVAIDLGNGVVLGHRPGADWDGLRVHGGNHVGR